MERRVTPVASELLIELTYRKRSLRTKLAVRIFVEVTEFSEQRLQGLDIRPLHSATEVSPERTIRLRSYDRAVLHFENRVAAVELCTDRHPQ